MKKKNFTKFEIVCYVVAALLAIAAVYMLVENIAYMNEYLAAYGMTFAALGGQAVQSIISAFVPYFTYALLVFAAGKIYHAVTVMEVVYEEMEEFVDEDEEEAEENAEDADAEDEEESEADAEETEGEAEEEKEEAEEK